MRPGVTYRPETSTVLHGLRGRDVGGDRGDFAVLDRHVPHGAQIVAGVDDVPALEEEVVVLRLWR